jgi:putative ABC transport system permease protein
MAVTHRSAWSWLAQETGLRFLGRRKGSAFVAVATLALALGINITLFAVVDALVLSTFGIPESSRLYLISPIRDLPGLGARTVAEAYANYTIIRNGQQSFSETAAFQTATASWDYHDEVRAVQAARVSASFFETLGTRPVRGRGFAASDEGPTPTPVVLISNALWQGALGGEEGVLGAPMILDGVVHEIIGIMPERVSLPLGADVWLPLGLTQSQRTTIAGARVLGVYGRLRPGITREGANADLQRLGSEIAASSPDNRDYRYELRTLKEAAMPGVDRIILSVQAGALVLLGLAGLNLSAILVAWGFDRRDEMAIRQALGAGFGRIVRHQLLQGGVIAALGFVGALGAAYLAIRILKGVALSPTLDLFLAELSLSPLTAAAGAAVAFLVMAIAVAIAIPLARPAAVAESVRASGRGSLLSRSAMRWQRAVVVCQSAMAVVLLMGAALLGISAHRLGSVGAGFDETGRYVGRIELAGARYASDESRRLMAARLQAELDGESELAKVAFVSSLPIGDGAALGRFLPQAPDGAVATDPILLNYRRASPEYFDVMGMPLYRGRPFTREDTEGSLPVAIVSRSLAARLWPRLDPVGRMLHRVVQDDRIELREVVGVVGDVVDAGFASPPGETVYVPYVQAPFQRISIVFVPKISPEAAVSAVRRAVRAADPLIPLIGITGLGTLSSQALALPRLQSWLLMAFGSIAIALAALGSFGVMSQLVANRQAEMALRYVLGASPTSLASLIFLELLRLSVPGAVFGMLIASAGAGMLKPFVFGIEPRSVWVMVLASVIVISAGILATVDPTVRAVRHSMRTRMT